MISKQYIPPLIPAALLGFFLVGCSGESSNNFLDPEAARLAAHPQVFVLKQGETQHVDLTQSVVAQNVTNWELADIDDKSGLGETISRDKTAFNYKALTAGTGFINYTVKGANLSATSQVVLAVNAGETPGNNLPLASNVTFTTPCNTIAEVDLRPEISDFDGDTLHVNNLISASGRFTLADNGYQVAFAPNGFVGVDQAVYSVDDGRGGYALAYIAAVSTNVNPPIPNNAPTAKDDAKQMDIATQSTLSLDLNPLINDVDDDNVSVVALYSSNDRATIESSGHVLYTPGNFRGVDQFTYLVSDDKGGYALGTLTVTVNDSTSPQPPALSLVAYPQAFMLEIGESKTVDLTQSVVAQEVGTWSLAQVQDNNGLGVVSAQTSTSFDYTARMMGMGSLDYTVQGGGLTATAQVVIVVNSPPSPANSYPEAKNIEINTLNNKNVVINLQDSISDIDGDSLSINNLISATGRFTLTDNQVTFAPNGFVGLDQAVYSVDDGRGGYALAYIIVTSKDPTPTSPNSSPNAHDYSQILDLVTTPVWDINLTELNLISDADGDTLKIVHIYSGNNRAFILDDNTIRYTPGNFSGLDQFTYAIVDTSGNYALGTISVTVNNSQPKFIIKIFAEQNVFGTKINTIPVQGQTNLTAVQINTDGSILDISHSVQWRSSDEAILSIDKAIAYAKKEGQVNIQASISGVDSNIVTIKVLNDTLKYINISPKNKIVHKYEELYFSAIAHYESGLTVDVTNLADWSSDNEEIASKNDVGSFIFNNEGAVIVKAMFDNVSSNESNIYVQAAMLKSLIISAPTDSIPAGAPLQLFAEGVFNDQQKYNLTSSVKWNITGSGTTINHQGIFIGNTLGTITLVGSINNIVSNEIKINVTDAKIDSLTLSPSILTIPHGSLMAVVLSTRYTDGTINNNLDGVNWHSSNENIVSIDNNGNIQGLNIGIAYVYASKLGVKSNEIAIAVINAKVTKIEVTPSYSSIPKGTNQRYKAYATYSDSTQYDLTSSVVWESDNTNIVEINTDGVAYGYANGEVRIKAIFDRIESNPATLMVKSAVLTSIDLQPKYDSIMVDGTIHYTANGLYSDHNIDNVNSLLTWRSSNESIAKVTAAGKVTGVSNGDVIISAYSTVDGKLIESQSTLHVDATKLITTIEIGQLTDFKDVNAGKVLASSSSGSDMLIKVEGITGKRLTPNTSRQIYAKATYTDGSTSYITEDVLWASNNTNIATVDHDGMVKALSIGDVIISAQKYGIKSNEFSFLVDNVAYTSCPTEKISLFINLATGGTQQLEFTCPAIMGDSNIYGLATYSPQENGFLGPNYMPVAKQPMQNDGSNNSPITYCQRLGYRITTNDELMTLWQAIDGYREGISGLYTNIGWPTLSEYWGAQKIPGGYTSIVNMVGGHILYAHDTYYTYYSCIK